MNLPEKYYREKLYPFQDGVLNIVKKLLVNVGDDSSLVDRGILFRAEL